MAKIDKTKLGVDASILDKARIELIEEKTPQINMVNRFDMEGINNTLEVRKKDGHYRPFLVRESQVLHANVARYMTTSIGDDRRVRDNRIMGEHLYKVPPTLYNYIARSSIRGRLEAGKVSVVDKNRCLLMTEDAFIGGESRAKDINELNMGINRHISNAQNLTSLLGLDLSTKTFEDAVFSGKPELWVYKMGDREPIYTYPSAMYLKLAINAFSKFSNERKTVTRENLALMGKTAETALLAYAEYLKHNQKIVELEEQHSDVYQLLQSTRFFSSMTPAIFEGIQENKQILDKDGNNPFKYIYGDPVLNPLTPIKERLTFDLSRAVSQGRLAPREQSFAKKTILELLKEEAKLEKILGNACESVVNCLNQVDKEQKLNLSEFEYNIRLLESLTNNYQSKEYISSLVNDFSVKYNSLAQRQETSILKKQQAQMSKELNAKKKLELDALEKKQNDAMRESLTKRILERYMAMYPKAVQAYSKDALLPTKNEQARIARLFGGADNRNEIYIGKQLEVKLSRELDCIKSLEPHFQDIKTEMEKSAEKIENLAQNSENWMIFNLISEVVAEQDKISRTSQQKISPKLTEKVVGEIVKELSDTEVEALYTCCFPTEGKGSHSDAEEILMCMQEVYNYKSQLLSYSNLKRNKEGVLNALAELNDMQNLDAYTLAYDAVAEIPKEGRLGLNVGKVRSLDEISDVIEAESRVLSGNPTFKDYETLESKINQQAEYMKNFGEASQDLLKSRRRYYEDIAKYNKERAKLLTHIMTRCRKIAENIVDEALEQSKDMSAYDFEKDGDEYVKKNSNGDELWRAGEEEYKEYVETNLTRIKDAFEFENFVDIVAEQEIMEELCKKCYPDGGELALVTKNELARASSVKEAVKVYKSRETMLDSLLGDMKTFKDFFETEYESGVKSSNLLAQVCATWTALYKEYADSAYQYRKQKLDIVEPYKSVIVEAYENLGDKVSNQVMGDFKRYRAEFRNSAREIVTNYSPRAVEAVPLQVYLSKTGEKATFFDGKVQAKMPQSIVGDNGLARSMYNMYKLKGEKTTLFDTFLGAVDDEQLGFDREYWGRSGSELMNYSHFISDITAENVEYAIKKIQEMDVAEMKKVIITSIQAWGESCMEAREFVMDPRLFEKTMRDLSSKRGIVGGELTSRFSYEFGGMRHQAKGIVSGESFNFYKVAYECLPKVREDLLAGTPVDSNYVDIKYLESFDALLTKNTPKKKPDRVLGGGGIFEVPEFPDLEKK